MNISDLPRVLYSKRTLKSKTPVQTDTQRPSSENIITKLTTPIDWSALPVKSEKKNGTKEYKVNNWVHRSDGPAVEKLNGTIEYWVQGRLHRIDGPAIIKSTGTKEWYLNGQRHRVDGPALESENRIEYWVNGLNHRVDGPAQISKHGNVYLQHNQLHRIDGPALFKNGQPVYYVRGRKVDPLVFFVKFRSNINE